MLRKLSDHCNVSSLPHYRADPSHLELENVVDAARKPMQASWPFGASDQLTPDTDECGPA